MIELEKLKNEIAVHADYKDLDQPGWETKIQVRGAHVKYDADLQHALNCYERKIPLLREMALDPQVKLKNPDGSLRTVAEVLFDKGRMRTKLETKIDRLIDKCACCLKEQELRKDGLVTRTPHNTDYFIDYGSGSDANDGLTFGNSYKTITKYTTTEVRSAGDRAFLRANVTWLQGTEAVDITFDEDGTIDAYIELIGADSVTNDPWSDASDIKPIIDFENGAFQVSLVGDQFWRFTRLDFRQSNDSGGMFLANGGDFAYLLECNFQDTNGISVEGIQISATELLTLDTCTFTDCFGFAVRLSTASVRIKDCTITAGTDVRTDTGLNLDSGSRGWVTNTVFAGSFDTEDAIVQEQSVLFTRNVDWTSAGNYTVSENAELHSADDDGTYRSEIETFTHGVITRDTGTVRSGGATSSAKMEPNSSCGPNRPLVLGSNPLRGFRPIWVTAGSYTATVYVRVGTAWDSALTAAEVYMVTSELDNAGNATRVERQSTETINNAGSWTALTTSISPARDGFVYFWLYLAEFEDATEHIFVDILPRVV